MDDFLDTVASFIVTFVGFILAAFLIANVLLLSYMTKGWFFLGLVILAAYWWALIRRME